MFLKLAKLTSKTCFPIIYEALRVTATGSCRPVQNDVEDNLQKNWNTNMSTLLVDDHY